MPNIFKKKDYTEQFIESVKNGDIDKMSFSLKRGADTNSRLDNGDTALIAAVRSGHLEVIKLLLDNGAKSNINEKDHQGKTALMYTSGGYGYEPSQPEIAKLLLDNGADVNAENKEGDTALSLSLKYTKYDIIKVFLSYGAFVKQDHYELLSDAFLEFSGYLGDLETVKLIIDCGIDINTEFSLSGKHAAIQEATTYGHLEIVKLLVQNGVNVNNVSPFGRSVLEHAIGGFLATLSLDKSERVRVPPGKVFTRDDQANRMFEIIKILIENGANVNHRTTEGKTLLALPQAGTFDDPLRDSGRLKLIDLLASSGATN